MNLQAISITGAALIALTLSTPTYSHDYSNGREHLAPPLLLENSDHQNDHWQGIGRLIINADYPDAHCTASLIDSRDGDHETAGPAYVLTSGHCISPDSLNVVADEPSDGYIDFNYFHDTPDHQQRVPVKQVNWSRQRGLDMAIVELDISLQSLMETGIKPLSLSTAAPAIGDPLLIVGAPSQYPENGLRLSTCSHVSTEDLVEQPAVFRGFYKDNCAGLKPGHSGSPLLDRMTNTVLGVVSTTTSDSLVENRCSYNAPCEVKDGQAHWSAQSNYSSPVSFLHHCFVQGQFTALAPGCDLMPTVALTEDRPTVNYYRRVKRDAEGNEVLPTWKFQFSLDTPFYRYKTVRDPLLCESPEHYSEALAAQQVLLNDSVGREPGIYLLCIVGVDSAGQSPTHSMMKSPLVLAKEIAEPGPTRAPQFVIDKQEDGAYSIAWHFSHPVLSGYEARIGAPDTLDCDEPEGYVRQLDDLRIGASELPAKLCTKAIDMSGQRSTPRTDLLGD